MAGHGSRKDANNTYPFETPYEKLLHTNSAPSEQECLRIRDFVVGPAKEFENNAAEIARLKAELDSLANRQRQLTEFIGLHLALLSGARRLPDDILREIFMCTFPANGQATMNPRDAPLLPTHVCRDWRSLALSMPQLWASLDIELAGDQAGIDEGVRSWLARSGDLPLSISFVVSDDCLRTSAPILEALIMYCHRWEHMRFILPSLDSYRPLTLVSPANVPWLKTIVMNPAGTWVEAVAASTSLSFMQATSITGVALMEKSVPPLDALLPWAQLSHLSLIENYISLEEALDVLRRCRNLEVFTARVYDDNTDASVDLEPVSMNNMSKLFLIDATSVGSTTRFFKHVVLQNLRCLEYRNNRRTTSEPLRVLSSLCAPEKITSLALSTYVSTESLAETLRLFPMLEKLVLHQPQWTLESNGAANCELFALMRNGATCPRLRDVSCFGPNAGSDEQLLEMLQERCAGEDGGPRLSRVHICFPREPQVDITGEVDALRVEIALVLRYPTDEQLKLIRKSTIGMTARKTQYAPIKEVDAGERDSAADWGPISGDWVADYADWGVLPRRCEDSEFDFDADSE
ncbi:hypothetical protein DFH07DRAFT_839112 [Mycena maculata]|uniref:F-box domain-containing protein n=1 Tax=Mycena maculata TaxID=230809 RepID=A0AAD7ID75_9AGAR|nr:hypothetical protein DFH07DRAFT_839112 [Mycena maculata]